jgi:hypothetical protein
MKTKFLKTLFVLLISLPFGEGWGGVLLSAQNGVTVSDLAISAGTVTFSVSWDRDAMPVMLWSDSVWVFVDYNNAGEMKRLPLSSASASAGTVIQIPGNDKGVWVVGNARSAGSFSATVTLLTATATATGACVYASNYPPKGEYTSTTTVAFTGTPNYTLYLTHTPSGVTSTATAGKEFILFPGYVITAFTDATGAPGTFHCIPPAAPAVTQGEFCYEQPGTLVAAAAENVIITWHNAATGGTLLHTGDILPLPPLYNTSTQYYAQAMYADDCRSSRTQAAYTVANCAMSGACPGFTAGNINAPTAPAACVAHYTGQIGAAALSPSCRAHNAGRIGRVKN